MSRGTESNGLEIRRECGYREINKDLRMPKTMKTGGKIRRRIKIRTTKVKPKSSLMCLLTQEPAKQRL